MSDYRVNHDTYTSAIEEAKRICVEKGFFLNEDELFQDIGLDSYRPKVGETERVTIKLYNEDLSKVHKKAMHVQVYGKEDGFELNCYIL